MSQGGGDREDIFMRDLQEMMKQMGLDTDRLSLLEEIQQREDLMISLCVLLNQMTLVEPERVTRAQSHCLYAAGHTVLASLYPEHHLFHMKEARYQYTRAQCYYNSTYYSYLTDEI